MDNVSDVVCIDCCVDSIYVESVRDGVANVEKNVDGVGKVMRVAMIYEMSRRKY